MCVSLVLYGVGLGWDRGRSAERQAWCTRPRVRTGAMCLTETRSPRGWDGVEAGGHTLPSWWWNRPRGRLRQVCSRGCVEGRYNALAVKWPRVRRPSRPIHACRLGTCRTVAPTRAITVPFALLSMRSHRVSFLCLTRRPVGAGCHAGGGVGAGEEGVGAGQEERLPHQQEGAH